jgi:hypothetical protein
MTLHVFGNVQACEILLNVSSVCHLQTLGVTKRSAKDTCQRKACKENYFPFFFAIIWKAQKQWDSGTQCLCQGVQK